jgi:peptide methionine sulfoxide reductase MsrA
MNHGEKMNDGHSFSIMESEWFKNPIVTQILPASEFWEAEEYQQQYYKRFIILELYLLYSKFV